MISGTGAVRVDTPNRGEQRKQLLDEREERIVEFMRQQRPVAAIAELEGLAEDYCRKACARLSAEHGIEYNPGKYKKPTSITDASRHLRRELGGILYHFRDAEGRHPLEVCRATGLTLEQQKVAANRPNDHDWTLGQIERLAASTNQDFTTMMLRCLLSTEQFQKVVKCLNS